MIIHTFIFSDAANVYTGVFLVLVPIIQARSGVPSPPFVHEAVPTDYKTDINTYIYI